MTDDEHLDSFSHRSVPREFRMRCDISALNCHDVHDPKHTARYWHVPSLPEFQLDGKDSRDKGARREVMRKSASMTPNMRNMYHVMR